LDEQIKRESDEDVDMSNATGEGSNGTTALTIEEDPLERDPQTPSTSTSTSVSNLTPNPDSGPNRHDPHSASRLVAPASTPGFADQPPAPSPIRFKQRVEVFEALLEFVNENAKQPSGNLLDSVNAMGEF
jgi:hypothetical protein